MDERVQVSHSTGDEFSQEAESRLTLKPYVDTLRRYRVPVFAVTGLTAVLFVLGALFVWSTAPTERVASVPFRLLFDGAADSQYPNGSAFSPQEIVEAPVLSAVFKKNDLQRFGAYEDFKDALFIQHSNVALDLLAYEYDAKLADARLTPVDRARVETEYKSRAQSIKDPLFELSLRRSERLKVMPRELMEKLLNDVLAEWAEQADVRRGVFRYPVSLFSTKTMSRENFEKDDYVIALDELRAQIVRVLSSIEQLEKLPGALTYRTKDNHTLGELRAALEDTLHFRVEPLIRTLHAARIGQNPAVVASYLSDRLTQVRLQRDEAQARVQVMQASLAAYVMQNTPSIGPGETKSNAQTRQGETSSVVPQLSDSFLDRLQAMSVVNKEGELEYRRRLTNNIITDGRTLAQVNREVGYYESLQSGGAGAGLSGSGSAESIRKQQNAAYDAAEATIGQLATFYQELSAANLNPASRLFAITGPYHESVYRALALDKTMMMFVFLTLLAAFATAAGCLLYAVVMDKIG